MKKIRAKTKKISHHFWRNYKPQLAHFRFVKQKQQLYGY
ncbi:DUF1661 domain-containing protein [Porphyromonas gulae]